jgi:hypothetical protein
VVVSLNNAREDRRTKALIKAIREK